VNPLVTAGPLKVGVARMLSTRPVGLAVGTVLRHRVPNHGLVFDTRHPAITPEVEAQLFFRIYEGAEIRFARQYLRGAEVVLDLGSSLGIVASHILAVMARGGRMICAEANPSLITCLEQTTSQHARGQLIDVVNTAILYEDGPAMLQTGRASVGSFVSSASDGDGIEVPSMTLGEVLDRSNVAGPFTLVSDIEGAEAGFILGDEAALLQCNLVLIELHSTTNQGEWVSIRDMYNGMLKQGFHPRDQHGPVFVFAR
jgi:FkbM family methyltransferase